MKTCENCEYIHINRKYRKISKARVFFGLFFVYSPAIFLPVILFAAYLAYLHLKIMGAENLKRLRDFLPKRHTHRYNYKSQIIMRNKPYALWTRSKTFWIANCTWYCPVSVASLEWSAYLVKAIENWWCPFTHERKHHYASAAIDASFWHDPQNLKQLHPDDRNNPIWNNSDKPVGKKAPAKKRAKTPRKA